MRFVDDEVYVFRDGKPLYLLSEPRLDFITDSIRFRNIFPVTHVNVTCVPPIKNVMFNDPATIVFWEDGTKTVVKCEPRRKFDKEKGLAMAIAKKAYGNKGSYNNIFKKWCGEDY